MKAMTNQQRDYALNRAKTALRSLLDKVAEDCVIKEAVEYSEQDLRDLFGDVCSIPLQENMPGYVSIRDLRKLFDMDGFETPTVYSDDFDDRKAAVVARFQHIENQIMLGDATEALEMILDFES